MLEFVELFVRSKIQNTAADQAPKALIPKDPNPLSPRPEHLHKTLHKPFQAFYASVQKPEKFFHHFKTLNPTLKQAPV